VSTRSFGPACQFVYDGGVLCFLRKESLEIIDIIGSNRPMRQITVSLSRILGHFFECRNENGLSLLHFSDSMLSVLFQDYHSNANWLLIFNVDFKAKEPEPILRVQVEEDIRRIFVRNTSEYLFYGIYSDEEWKIRGISLNEALPFPKEALSHRDSASVRESTLIPLKGFSSSEIGFTVAFKIHDGYFWAIANGDDIDVIEVDWTSVYRCARFPVKNPRKESLEFNDNLFRRQHNDGPINDNWTELSLQVDEKTNKLMAVEGRMEWLDSQSQQTRSFYITEIKFPAPKDMVTMQNAPENDTFTRLATSRSRYQEAPIRQTWQVHPEEAHMQQNLKSDIKFTDSLFIPVHTKFKTYNLSANTFIDLVDDHNCCSRTVIKPQSRKSCLRLRTGSRRLRSFQDIPEEIYDAREKLDCKDEEERNNQLPVVLEVDKFDPTAPSPYSYSPITLWPESKHINAHRAMNPEEDGYSYLSGVHVIGAADERTLVYLVRDASAMRASKGSVYGKLVVLSFDRESGISKLETGDREVTPPLCYGSSTPKGISQKSLKRPREDDELENFKRMPSLLDSGNAIINSLLEPIEQIILDFSDPGWGDISTFF
jgi:hypothetical protein